MLLPNHKDVGVNSSEVKVPEKAEFSQEKGGYGLKCLVRGAWKQESHLTPSAKPSQLPRKTPDDRLRILFGAE
jgi:hypothetical protein